MKNKYLENNQLLSLLSIQSQIKSVFMCNRFNYNENTFESINLNQSSINNSTNQLTEYTMLLNQLIELNNKNQQQQQMIVQLQQQQQQINQSLSQHTTQSTSSLNYNQTNPVYDELNKLKLQFKNVYFKSKRFKAHAQYFERYIIEKKVPPSLFYKQFPRPFLPHDPAFVDSYNNIIREFQTAVIKLCSQHVQKVLDDDINPKVERLTNEIKLLTSDGDTIIREVSFNVDKSFENDYLKTKERKYNRIELKLYKANNRQDDSFSNLSDTLDGANNYNSRKHSNSNGINRSFNNNNGQSLNSSGYFNQSSRSSSRNINLRNGYNSVNGHSFHTPRSSNNNRQRRTNYGNNQSHVRFSSTTNNSINQMSQNESNFRMSHNQNGKG